MKRSFLFALAASFVMQTGIVAQPYDNRPTPRVEVQVQRLPSSDEGTYYDRSGASPQTQVNYSQDTGTQSYQQTPGGNNTYYRGNPSNTESNASDQSFGIIDETTQQPKERTLSILKPDAVRNRHIGDIIARFENSGLHVIGIKMVRLTPEQAAQFYNIHKERPFFKDLIQFMSSGPVVVMVLEGEQAISKNRQLMGATDPKKAEKGTIRADYAQSVSQNAVHGSDSSESANVEIPFFFKANELYPSD